MRFKIFSLPAAVGGLSLVSTVAAADPAATLANQRSSSSVSSEDSANVIPGAYVVEWETDMADAPGFYQSLGLEVEHRLDLKYQLFKGASFRIINGSNDVSNDISGMIAARPENGYLGAVRWSKEAASREPDTYAPHVMTQVDKLRAEGYTGKGIRIGIVDSGVDYTHPALGGCFGERCLVSYGWDLTGDNYFPPSSPEPDADPYDGCVGHGTHVAGIIAAQANELGFTGAAPEVTIGAYRAWGCNSLTTNDILLDAFYAAFEDGRDIISCSAGQYTGWANDPWGIAASRIAAQGVSVIVAPGNSGRSGMFLSASPATGVKVTASGSVDNTITPLLLTAGSYTVDNATGISEPFGFISGGPEFAENITLPLWTVVLLRVADTSECYSSTQATNVAAKGDGITGVGTVTPAQGATWINLLNQGSNVNIYIVDPAAADIRYEAVTNDVSGDLTSVTTAWGPTWEVVSKPQFTAPGGNILSTWPMVMGEYSVLSGTSMSTPLIAAVFALVGQARGTTNPVELRNILSSTSRARPWFDGTNVHDILAPVPQQGSGVVQAYDAAHAKTILSVSDISFNDTENFVAQHTSSIRNTGGDAVIYQLGHTTAATAYTFASGSRSASQFPNPTVDDWAKLSFSSETISMSAGSSVEVTVTVVPPRNVNATQLPVYSGLVTIEADGGETHNIPYVGVAGSMKETSVFLEGPEDGTFLGYFNNPTAPNTTFTIPRPRTTPPGNVEYPSIQASLLFGTQMARADVVAISETGLLTTAFFDIDSIGFLSGFPEPWVVRRNYRLGFTGELADGTVVPEGTYKIVFSGLLVFDDRGKRADWDFAETVPFVIRYID
ncbi:subtilisin-like serine protease pr1c [Colletotrichum asianum]|uniref:Subtilisin-like serine protease pr1c n=1 Tax=Colletotrichum asianum TaxID=702518 RepID=A0A8H3VXH9_9PEZI|nr:subtilisin-like serine protease pr1c [Colletotrichum asianum]